VAPETPPDVWGVGSYEITATELEPAAEVAVEALELSEGERLLDIGCGTGNAALEAERAGAAVAGIDPSPRLVQVARRRIPGGQFVEGSATDMPFDDDSFDAAVSVFALIFVSPAERAVAEMARVVRPRGRAAITSWPARGPVFESVMAMRRAMARVRPPESPPPAQPDWGDPDVLRELLGAHGEVEVSEQILPAEVRNPEQVWARWEESHPIWIGAKRVLGPAGEWEGLREETLDALRGGDLTGAPYMLSVLRVA
jgi:SAM-dependent methyltransferase